MKKIRVYVGHKLTKANPQFLERMKNLREYAETALVGTCEFLKFLGVKGGTAWDVFEQDIEKNVKSCDLFVCIVDEESTGLGMEIGASVWKSGKPMLLIYTSDAHVSRLPLGAIEHYPQQIMERSIGNLPSGLSQEGEFNRFIEEAISAYRLFSDNPVRFPCLDDLAPRAGLKIGVPIQAQSGWRS